MKDLQRFLGLLLAIVFLTPALAAAQVGITGSSSVDVQIQSLLSQIDSLEQQLHSLVITVAPSSTPPMWNASSTPPNKGGQGMGMGDCPSFVRDLSIGSQGSDVMQLQSMLSQDGFLDASSTGFFGSLTAHALTQFQIKFGISTSSAGFFGPLTRNFLSAHCGNGQPQGGGQGQGGGMMGSSTRPMWPLASTTLPMNGANGGVRIGSSTPPRPCPQNAPNNDQGAASALLQLHVLLPIMFNPCGGMSSSSMTQ